MSQVSMSMIKDDNKKYKETVDIPIDIQGQELNIRMFPYFKPSKIQKMLEDIRTFILATDKEKVELGDNELDGLIGYYIIKHFTDIKMTTSKKAKVIYDEYKQLIEHDLYKVLMKSFPQESKSSVYESLLDVLELSAVFEKQQKLLQRELMNAPLENKDILLPNLENNSDELDDEV